MSDEPANITAESFKTLYNPLKLPGLYYICHACEETTIPHEDSGNVKRRVNDQKSKRQTNDEESQLVPRLPIC